MDVRVRVTHRVGAGPAHTTRVRFPVPENIDPANVESFVAAMIERGTAEHLAEQFNLPAPRDVEALRWNVLAAILEAARQYQPNRRLADRLLAVLRLNDAQLLERYREGRRGEVDG